MVIKVGICSYFSVYFCFPTIIHIEIYFYDIYPYNDNTHRHWDVEQVEVEQGGKLSKWEVEQVGI